jgi:predicted aconitase
VDLPDLLASWNELNSASRGSGFGSESSDRGDKSDSSIGSRKVDVVCLGNPHFSATECRALAALCSGRTRHPSVDVIVTLGRDAYEKAVTNGTVDSLEEFGVQFINDTCWCMIEEPIIRVDANVLMTNSAKYAHYGPGLVNRPIYFGSLAECVAVACSGSRVTALPDWLVTGAHD